MKTETKQTVEEKRDLEHGLAVLNRAYCILSYKEASVHNVRARRKNGEACSPISINARKFSLLGALIRATLDARSEVGINRIAYEACWLATGNTDTPDYQAITVRAKTEDSWLDWYTYTRTRKDYLRLLESAHELVYQQLEG